MSFDWIVWIKCRDRKRLSWDYVTYLWNIYIIVFADRVAFIHIYIHTYIHNKFTSRVKLQFPFHNVPINPWSNQ